MNKVQEFHPVVCELDDAQCNGRFHDCWNCGGDGWVASEDGNFWGEEYTCHHCHGKGGWPCPAAELNERTCA